jgi:hypothetical protein
MSTGRRSAAVLHDCEALWAEPDAQRRAAGRRQCFVVLSLRRAACASPSRSRSWTRKRLT